MWRIELYKNAFDDACQAGLDLRSDLSRLDKYYGQDYILLEFRFEQTYPVKPFLARVVSPRCMPYTGHVLHGGE